MSMVFHVAVEAESWPSFHDINAAIAARRYPLKFLTGEAQADGDPFERGAPEGGKRRQNSGAFGRHQDAGLSVDVRRRTNSQDL